MKNFIVPENYNENAYAHEMVGGYISNVEYLYERYKKIVACYLKIAQRTGRVPTQKDLVGHAKFGSLIREAHWYHTSCGETWKKEKGDTLCARLWLADYVIEDVNYHLNHLNR